MTREEYIEFANALKNNYTIDFDKLPEFCDMAISALSAEPCREADDYENEIADLHNRLDIAEYDKERYKEEITTLEAKNKGEWIPVSERLPENSDYVLVTDGLDMFVAWHNPEKERFKGWHSFDELFDLQTPILAWQPLPEPAPYKSEKTETCKGCLEPCIMYEPDMRACKKKVTERGE